MVGLAFIRLELYCRIMKTTTNPTETTRTDADNAALAKTIGAKRARALGLPDQGGTEREPTPAETLAADVRARYEAARGIRSR